MGISIRPTGLENAAAALRYWERRQEVLANNLANVNTAGFKGEHTFAHLLSDGATPVIDSATDLTPGPIVPTGAPFDVAIEKDGFFVIQTPLAEKLSRGGEWHVNERHVLVDQSGNPVLGEDDAAGGTRGHIIIPAEAKQIDIDRAGAVKVDGTQIARLRVESVSAGIKLLHEGAGLFAIPDKRASMTATQRSIRQGATEESNVSSISSMVDMISVQRAYASVQKVMTTINSARGTAATEIGKPV